MQVPNNDKLNFGDSGEHFTSPQRIHPSSHKKAIRPPSRGRKSQETSFSRTAFPPFPKTWIRRAILGSVQSILYDRDIGSLISHASRGRNLSVNQPKPSPDLAQVVETDRSLYLLNSADVQDLLVIMFWCLTITVAISNKQCESQYPIITVQIYLAKETLLGLP